MLFNNNSSSRSTPSGACSRSSSHTRSRRITSGPAVAMRSALLLGALSLGALSLGACGEATAPAPGGRQAELTALPRALTVPEQQAIRASNAFGLTLLHAVSASNPGENVVLSPFSASVALGMAYAGADGETATAMRTTLGWGDASRSEVLDGYRALPAMLAALDPQVTFTSANSLWVKDDFVARPAYIAEMKDVFAADVRNRAFVPATLAEINAWASTNTNGRIPQVIDAFPNGLVALLMNALYFKGSWRDRFDVSQTQPGPFTTASGATPSVPFMRRFGEMGYTHASGAQWVELAYGNAAFVMTLALPDSNVPPTAWLSQLTPGQLDAAVQGLHNQKVDLALPKLHLEVDYQLKEALAGMGMGVAFDPGNADFARLSEEPVFLSSVKQDVFLDVNEEGTEAAAVTQVGVSVTSAPLVPVVHFNRPFVLLIRERLSGTVLFAGVIAQP